MKRRFALIAVLFLIPFVSGQVSTDPLLEGFEDDTLAATPTSGWYSLTAWSGTTTLLTDSGHAKMVGQYLEVEDLTGGGGAGAKFSFDFEVEPTYVSFDFYAYRTQSSGAEHKVYFDKTLNNQAGQIVREANGVDGCTAGSGCQQWTDCGLTNADGWEHRVEANITINWGAGTYSCLLTNTDTLATKSASGVSLVSAQSSMGGFSLHDDSDSGIMIDNLDIGGLSLPSRPNAPAGLTVEVIEPKTTASASDEFTLQVEWPLSSDDPDQNTGDYTYTVYVDAAATADTVTAADGDGARVLVITVGGTLGQNPAVYVTATNATSGMESSPSCVVVPDQRIQGDVVTCGAFFPGGGPQTPGTFPGVDIEGFATSTGISLSSAGWILGLFLTVGLAGGLYGALGNKPAGGILGGFLGVGVSTAFGLMPVWFVVFVVLCSISVIVMRLRSGN